jgi:hypothetical protein
LTGSPCNQIPGLVPLPRARHEPVADPQVKRVIEPVVDPSQINRVVECRGRENDRCELQPRIECEARKLDKITIDLDRLVIGNRQSGASAVDPVLGSPREAEKPCLSEHVCTQFKRDLLLISGADQDEHAQIFVIAACQEFRELMARRLGERDSGIG